MSHQQQGSLRIYKNRSTGQFKVDLFTERCGLISLSEATCAHMEHLYSHGVQVYINCKTELVTIDG